MRNAGQHLAESRACTRLGLYVSEWKVRKTQRPANRDLRLYWVPEHAWDLLHDPNKALPKHRERQRILSTHSWQGFSFTIVDLKKMYNLKVENYILFGGRS